MTDVHQCPGCELRFRNKTELEYHWAEEHAEVPRVPETDEHPEPGGQRPERG